MLCSMEIQSPVYIDEERRNTLQNQKSIGIGLASEKYVSNDSFII